jgi:hypothetical protein
VVRLNQRFSRPSLDPICLVVTCARPSEAVQHVGGRSHKSLHILSPVGGRSLPHTYSYTYFYSKEETKVETGKDSTGSKHRGSKFY